MRFANAHAGFVCDSSDSLNILHGLKGEQNQ